MNTTMTPPRAAAVSAAPRARIGSRWQNFSGAVLEAFEAAGRVRAQPHLRALANRVEARNPELARDLRAAMRHGPLD